ncbi:MAG: hypothetical protein BWX68_03056 [Verrucomicrobia bacterium ADurb.Bin063]|nr:MAG: hypothetical protein BWX68_03056 [Verrucomicrobia bacterium ADurb.Bin063]
MAQMVHRGTDFGGNFRPRASVKVTLHSFIAERGTGADERAVSFALVEPAGVVEDQLHGVGQVVFVGAQTAHLDGEIARQHANDAVHQISAVAAAACLAVNSRVGFHIRGDIRDVYAQLPAAIGQARDGNGVVLVVRRGGVNGEDQPVTQIHAARPVSAANRRGDLPRRALHLRREVFFHAVILEQRRNVVVRVIRLAEVILKAGGHGAGRGGGGGGEAGQNQVAP